MPVFVRVEADRFRDVLGRFARVTDQLAVEHSRQHILAGALLYQQAFREEAPRGVPDPLGRPRRWPPLAENINMHAKQQHGGWVIEFQAPPQVRFVVLGTKPHEIRGRDWPLHFYWHKKGIEAWFWKVNHPGSAPNRFDQRAAQRVRAQASAEMRRGCRSIVELFMQRQE